MDHPRIYRLSETAFTVELGNEISLEISDRVLGLQRALENNPAPGLQEMVPAYASLTIYLKPTVFRDPVRGRALILEWEQKIRATLGQSFCAFSPEAAVLEVPVCYHQTMAPDLAWVAAYCNLSAEDVIRIHSAPLYRVYMTGFVPGFPYMGVLDARLQTPRKQRPGRAVAAGSVAIAGMQTGIYPLETPGGWQVIGKTPMKLFDPAGEGSFLLRTGMNLRFKPISLEAYLQYQPG